MTAAGAAAAWGVRSETTLRAARLLYQAEHWHGCANRAYYAAYQASTSVLIDRGVSFPNGWNNPSHEQLPGLIRNMSSCRD